MFRKIKRKDKISWNAMLVVLLSAPSLAVAQDENDNQAQHSALDFDASLVVRQIYDDNIFSTRSNRIADGIAVINPYAEITVDFGDFEIELNGDAEIGRYYDNSSEDYEDYTVGGVTRFQWAPGRVIFGGARYQWDHEDRSSPDDANGFEPTLTTNFAGFAGARIRAGKWRFGAAGSYDKLGFDDVGGAFGMINQDDRDREMVTAGVRVGRMATSDFEVFTQASYDLRAYRIDLDDSGFDRDSSGLRASAGLRYRPNGNLDAEIFAGYLHQEYDDASFDNISTADVGALLKWRSKAGFELSARFDRSLEETTFVGSSGYLSTGGTVTISQWLRPDIKVFAGAGYSESNYRGIEREDQLTHASLGGRYYVTPHGFVGVDYRFFKRDSTTPDDEFEDSRFMLTVGAALDETFDRASAAYANRVPADASGFYVGVQAGYGDLATEHQGPRGSGELLADFAEPGLSGAVVAGYGATIGNWYLGLEADVQLSDTTVSHNRTGGGRVFTIERDEGYGISLLSGRFLPDGALFYGRAGVNFANFTTSYAHAGESIISDDLEAGLRFGLGVMAPVTGPLSMRIEYTYASYDDYDVVSSGATDLFSNSESILWTGATYGFSAAPASRQSDARSFSGFYIGAQAGHGVLGSRLEAPRGAGSVLTADFGDEGATGGAFAGFGAQISDLYFGAEAEVEFSDAMWAHLRRPTGRTFSIEKDLSYGGALRVGYVVGQSVLFYGRAGFVWSDLDTKFHRGSDDIAQSTTERGARFGGGVEAFVKDKITIRLDYTSTNYDDYSLATASGDVERYAVDERLFRVGIAYRFN